MSSEDEELENDAETMVNMDEDPEFGETEQIASDIDSALPPKSKIVARGDGFVIPRSTMR